MHDSDESDNERWQHVIEDDADSDDSLQSREESGHERRWPAAEEHEVSSDEVSQVGDQTAHESQHTVIEALTSSDDDVDTLQESMSSEEDSESQEDINMDCSNDPFRNGVNGDMDRPLVATAYQAGFAGQSSQPASLQDNQLDQLTWPG
nr:nuclear polyadenylated RNA-binding protein 3-like [Pseudochaenichthys georgianus]